MLGCIFMLALSFSFVYLLPAGLLDGLRGAGAPAADNGQRGEGEAADDAASRPHFDFYRLLPDKEVEPMPARGGGDGANARSPTRPSEQARGPASAPASPSTRSDGPAYFLQVGSFRGSGEAEKLHATLALSGIESQIRSAPGSDGRLWHRVLLGPYANPADARAARDELGRDHAITDTVLLRE